MERLQFYYTAGHTLERLESEEGLTVKAAVLNDPKVYDKKRTYALIAETLQFKRVIDEIIDRSNVLQKERYSKVVKNRAMARLFIHDLLFSKDGLQLARKNKTRLRIREFRNVLYYTLELIKKEWGITDNEELREGNIVNLPRFVRVNTHKTDIATVIKHFAAEGYKYLDEQELLDGTPYSALQPKQFCSDYHIPELLVFAHGTDLHAHPLYESGDIILQDKASCLPARALNPPHHATVIDGCAAPGNKTSHLSALMSNTGKIFAFDKDGKRLDLLKRLTAKADCQNIHTKHTSFLEEDPKDPMYKDVEYILLDPSCSGSGIVNRLDELLKTQKQVENEEKRLRTLSDFQVKMVLHAFKFPKVKRVAYSTCSIHTEENEEVVKRILAETKQFKLVDMFAETMDRGLAISSDESDQEIAKMVLRTDPRRHLTNGFFVAVFQRKNIKDTRPDDLWHRFSLPEELVSESRKLYLDRIQQQEEEKTLQPLKRSEMVYPPRGKSPRLQAKRNKRIEARAKHEQLKMEIKQKIKKEKPKKQKLLAEAKKAIEAARQAKKASSN